MISRLTLVAESELPEHLLADTREALTQSGWLGLRQDLRGFNGLAVADFLGQAPRPSIIPAQNDVIVRELASSWRLLGVAVIAVPSPAAVTPPSLVVSGVDSVLVPVETRTRIAELSPTGVLSGIAVSDIHALADSIEFSPGVIDLVKAVHGMEGTFGVLSESVYDVVDRLVIRAEVDRVIANRLEAQDGVTTGHFADPVVDGSVKRAALTEWSGQLGGLSAAIGHDLDDLPMLEAADFGIAYCAPADLADRTHGAIPFPRLDAAIPLLGLA